MKKFKELDLELRTLFKKETKIIGEVIATIREIDRTRGYLKDYSSMFAYLTEGIGYCKGSAQLRIDAARLSSAIPEVAEKLNNGSVNLSSIGVMAQGLRQTEQELSEVKKKELLEKLENKSKEEAQVIVAQELDLPTIAYDKTRKQKDESVRIESTFNKEQLETYQTVKSLLSHVNSSPTFAELFEIVGKFFISKHPLTKMVSSSDDPKATYEDPHYITPNLKRKVFQRDGCCKFKTAVGFCKSKHQLQVHHIIPVWVGGKTVLENLQLMCAQHNRYVFREQIGRRWA